VVIQKQANDSCRHRGPAGARRRGDYGTQPAQRGTYGSCNVQGPRRRTDALSRAHKQLVPKLLPQSLEGMTDGRLRKTKAGRSARDASFFQENFEDWEEVEIRNAICYQNIILSYTHRIDITINRPSQLAKGSSK
jgi:hypothetical protein